MVERLLGRLGSRFVFVVGKGGVGKSTTAGALALAMAERGERVHLLSTDPAHSLGDLFGIALAGAGAVPSPCSGNLVLEELDAEGRWSAWRDAARGPLVDLLDRGTYLDRVDVEAFLDLSLPGVDEVAAALRLTDLEAGDAERVVVDTAPTGHTLRLLATGRVLSGWSDVFDAVDAKARAVVEGLMRTEVRLPSADVVDDLRDRARRFEKAVVAGADAVVVGRSEPVVEAESRRLTGALVELGLVVSARVVVGGSSSAGDDDVLGAPWNDDLTGCDGLRRWGTAAGAATATGPGAGAGAVGGDPRPVVAGLPRDLVFFVGKGGVGKTTCAATVALALAADRDVELLGVDPAGSLGDALGRPVGADGLKVGRLTVRELDADRAFADFKQRYRDEVEEAFRRVGLHQSAALDRRVVASLLDLAPPGVDELLAVSALLVEARPGTTRVVDTAPTGHLLRLLETPESGLAWVRQLMRVLVKYRAALGLDALAERLLDLAKQLKDMNLRISDPERTGAVLVELAGPLDRAESARLRTRLEGLGMPLSAVIANRWRPGDAPPAAAAPVLLAPTSPTPLVGADALTAFLPTWAVA